MIALKTIIDITLPISQDLPLWPGTPGVEVTQIASLDIAGYKETRICMGAHVGTHIDAPSHFLERGGTIESLPLDVLIGEVYVADVQGVSVITADVLDLLNLPAGLERVLFKTDNACFWAAGDSQFQKDFVALSLDAAEWLVAHGVRLVGIDYLSVQRFHDSNQIHIVLLEAGVIIVEGLNLTKVFPGFYELVCLPLPITGGEAAPARVVLRTL
jgi:arylformamidase